MTKNLLSAFSTVLLTGIFFTSSAQHFHCYKALKKQEKACKKENKIRKKMFHDRPYKAERKYVKADHKDWKAEGKEFYHDRFPGHVDYYW